MTDSAAAPSFERFELECKLGSGGFGAVYRAFDRKRNTVVALKVLNKIDPGHLYRFKQEFRSLADIHHPNLVSLYELVEDRERWLIAMELIEGVNFLEYVRGIRAADDSTGMATASIAVETEPSSSQPRSREFETGEIDFDRLRDCFGQLVRGLNALHAAGKLHRDVKPGNVLVERGGRVVLLDFGLVTELGAQHPRDFAGTVAYMAPEITAGRLGAFTDWFAAGAMLYECLTGSVPRRPSLFEEIAPPSTQNPNTPPDLDAICMRLLAADPDTRPGGAEIQRAFPALTSPAPAPGAMVAPGPATLFVGRAAELAQLHDALAASRREGTVVVGLHGASGIGKSALLRQFLHEVAEAWPEAAVLEGRCFDRESVPYKALDGVVDALSQFLRRVPAEDAEEFVPRDAGSLARIFSVLRRVAPVTARRRRDEAAGPQELRRRAFAALREMLQRIGDDRPLVISIDDLQWSDLDSIPILEALLREPDAPRMLFVALYRSAEAQTSAPLRALLPVLAEARRYFAIEVGGLPDRDARRLAESLGDSSDPAAVTGQAGGNPFLIDLLSRRQASGAATLEEAIESQLQDLPARGRQLLELLSVAGQPLASAMAAQIVPGAADPGLLAGLRAQRLVRSRIDGDSEQLETYHDRIRESIAGRMDTERLTSHHRLLARAYAAAPDADDETVARHYFSGGLPERAAPFAEAAAGHAFEALAFDRAAALYRLAIECRGAQGDSRSLHMRLGEALSNAGRGREAAAAFLLAAEGAAPSERMNLTRMAAEQYLVTGHMDEGLEAMRRVLQSVGLDLPASPAAAIASIVARRLYMKVRRIEFQPRPISAIPPEDLLRIDACASAAFGLSPVDPIRGFDFQTRQLLLAVKAGDLARYARAVAQDVSGLAARGGGSWAHTNQVREQAIALAESTGSPQALYLARSMSGTAYFFNGRWEEALREFNLAEEVRPGLSSRSAGETATLHIISSACLINTGRWRELAARLPDLLWEARDRGNLSMEVGLRARCNYIVHLAAGDPGRAQRETDEAIARWSPKDFHLPHFYAFMAGVEIALYRADAASAFAIVERDWGRLSKAAMFRVQVVFLEALKLRARAAIALAAASRGSTRERLLRVAEADMKRMRKEKMPWSIALETVLEAALAHLRGNRAAALGLLERASGALDAAHMPLNAAAARRARAVLSGGSCSDEIFAAQGIRDAAAIVRMMAPGLEETC